jgi:D-alanine-D-alanine ligase-like ATP-grasp enzyme
LLPKAAAAAGMSYEALCQRMIELALNRRSESVKAA